MTRIVASGLYRPNGPLVARRVLRTWEGNSPRMLRALRRWNAAEPLAHVLVDRCIKSETHYIQAGLPPCDAREEAERDWLMMEPEDDDNGFGVIC